MTEMPPSGELFLVPFETRLLGRLVVNPNRPMHDYVDCDTVPPFTTSEISNVHLTFRSRFRPQRVSDSKTQNSVPNDITVRATRGFIYSVSDPSDWWEGLYQGYYFRKCEMAAWPYNRKLYVITGLQIVQDYSTTVVPWGGFGGSGTPEWSKELAGSGVPQADHGLISERVTSSADRAPDPIVISMTFTVLNRDWSLCGTGVKRSFLDWEHNPHYTPVIESDVRSGGSLARTSLLGSSRASKSEDDGSRRSSLDDDGSRAISSKDDRSRAFSLHDDAERWPSFEVASIPENSPEHIPDEPNICNESTIDPNIHQSSPLSHLTVPLGPATDPTSDPSADDQLYRVGMNLPDEQEGVAKKPSRGRPRKHPQPSHKITRTSKVGRSKTKWTRRRIAEAIVMDHSWPIQFSRGKRNISFPFQCRPSLANTTKAWIEQVVREPINWWPLSPRRHPLPANSVWVDWECACGKVLSTTISTEHRTQYNQWISCTNGTSPTPSKPIPTTTATLTSVSTSNSPPNLPAVSLSGALGATSNSPNAPPATGQASSKPPKLLMWCINLSARLTVVTSLMVPLTDEDVFRDLGTQYRKTRGWSNWFSLHTVSEIRFVMFAPYRVERIGTVDRVRVTCSDTEQLPTPTNPAYEYEPKPPAEIPPVPARLLMEYFEHPSCAGTSTAILEALPLRTTGLMSRQEKYGWGLHAGEHLSFYRIGVLAVVILVGPTWFFVHWLCVHPGDLQNASVPLFLALAFIGTFVVMFDRGK